MTKRKKPPLAPPKPLTAKELDGYPGFRPEIAREFWKGYNAAIRNELKKWKHGKPKPH